MIIRLRKRFIRIAVLSVALVMLLLSLVVNLANFISVNADVDSLLDMLSNRGAPFGEMQPPGEGFHEDIRPDDPRRGEKAGWFDERGGKRFNSETPFSTRFFTFSYDEDGNLLSSDLSNIAAVTENEIDEFVTVALRHGDIYALLLQNK